VPHLNISVILSSHVSCLANEDPPVIFISAIADPDLRIKLLAQHLTELFDSTSYAEEVELLLSTDEAETEALLTEVFQIPLTSILAEEHLFESLGEGDVKQLEPLEDGKEEILKEVGYLEDVLEQSLEIVETFELADRYPNKPEAPTFQIAELRKDYTTAIFEINLNFETNLRKTRYDQLTWPANTGFAGEFLVLHPLFTFVDRRFISC
jgi:hypothetical protein